jgi:hypothetical protein
LVANAESRNDRRTDRDFEGRFTSLVETNKARDTAEPK